MPVKVSDYLGIDDGEFEKTGAFNAILDVDSNLFIDPQLLKKTEAAELKDSYSKVKRHFSEILTLVSKSKRPGDALWREASKRLRFREVRGVCIGYGRNTYGSGIGGELRDQLLSTAKEIVDAGISEPEVFELIGLLEENVGADRISDMVARIILEDLLRYSERVFRDLRLPPAQLIEIAFRDKTFKLPINQHNRSPIILVPKDILRDLPIAKSWEDISSVVALNAALRNKVNQLIGREWKRRAISQRKRELKGFLLRNPDIFRDVIETYKRRPKEPYDFEADPAGEVRWLDASRRFANTFPLQLHLSPKPSANEVLDVVRRICSKFKDLVENNGLHTELYTGSPPRPRRESTAQKLFYATADIYCDANNLDLSRETNAGRGPVDFKVSSGYHSRVLVEVKLSANTRLVRHFQKQLREYQKAEKTKYAIYMVLLVNGSQRKLEDLMTLAKEAKSKGERIPELIIVDGRPKPSASKM